MNEQPALTPNAFTGSDVERINRLLQVAAGSGPRVVIRRRNRPADGDSDVSSLDTGAVR